jgi:hypothetical protein
MTSAYALSIHTIETSPGYRLKWILLVLKSTVIPVTWRGGLWGCETLRILHFLDSALTDSEVILTLRPHFTPHEDSWYSFLLETVNFAISWTTKLNLVINFFRTSRLTHTEGKYILYKIALRFPGLH